MTKSSFYPKKKGRINDLIREIQDSYSSNNEIEIEERIELRKYARKILKRMSKKELISNNEIVSEIIKYFFFSYHNQS